MARWQGWILALYQWRLRSKASGKRELFGMEEKDRPLLQQIGMKMREIRESVWLDAIIRESEKHELVVCDDVRFINEAKTLKEHGWFLIKLDINDDFNRNRLHDDLSR